VWLHHWANAEDLAPYPFDPVVAAQLLDSSGLRAEGEPPANGRLDRAPARFRFTCLILAGYPEFERTALIVQRQLYELGVDMEVQAAPYLEVMNRITSGNFDAFLTTMPASRGLTWPFRLWHSPTTAQPFLASGYDAADGALQHLRLAQDELSFRRAAGAFQRILHDDPPAIFLAWDRTSRAVSRRFAVPDDDPYRDILSTIWQWKELAPRPVQPE
jgi:peptide/nickel transport system substrate-binding protein